MTGKRSIEYPQ